MADLQWPECYRKAINAWYDDNKKEMVQANRDGLSIAIVANDKWAVIALCRYDRDTEELHMRLALRVPRDKRGDARFMKQMEKVIGG